MSRHQSHESRHYRFAVTPLSADDGRSRQIPRNMAPHPLNYQELPFAPEYFVYNGRLASDRMNNATDEETYWLVRRRVILRHTGERPIEIRGADAEALLNRVFTRDIARVKVGRCSYQFACYHDGGMITDGVLLRLEPDRFWYAQADGDLFSWFRAQAHGLRVEVSDPGVWVSQVQGPHALDVLSAVAEDGEPDPFRYFDVARVRIAGQSVIITRSGFTNELGWEFYLEPGADARAVGDSILAGGERYGIKPVGAVAFRTRRIEAGLLSAGTDFDQSVTPFAAGLGQFVDMDKTDFIGKVALEAADRRRRTWGLQVDGGVAELGRTLTRGGAPVGIVCSSAWSPYLQRGVAIVRLDDPMLGPGEQFEVACTDNQLRSAAACDTPMYDSEREIPRGKRIEVPEIPSTPVES